LASNCVVVDAAPIEPVSSVEIPRKLGKYWEFRSFWTCGGLIGEQFQKLAGQNSHARKLGIYFRKWENAKRRGSRIWDGECAEPAAVPERQAPHCWRM